MNLEALKAAIMKRSGKDIDVDALLSALMPNEGEEMEEGMMAEGMEAEAPEMEAGEEQMMVAQDDGKDLAPDLANAPAQGSQGMDEMIAKFMASRGKKPQAMAG